MLCIFIFLLGFETNVRAQPQDDNRPIITEVYYDTPGADIEQEWVEVANLGNDFVSLSNFKIGDEESIWGGEGMWRFPAGSVLAPNQVIVIAQEAAGFRGLYGRDPDFEIKDTVDSVPDMVQYKLWSSGDFALANDGDEVLLLNEDNLVVDAINYGDSLTYFFPAIGDVYSGQSIERIPALCDTDTAGDWQPQRYPTPGTVDLNGVCAFVSEPTLNSSNLLAIGQIQGSGDVSPYVNQMVEFRGVVSGFREDRNEAGIVFHTIFVQDAPGEEDQDPKTSDGIAIFLELEKPIYKIGDFLQISGKVTEFYGLTEIDDDELIIERIGDTHSLPEPIAVSPPEQAVSVDEYFESLESSLVMIPDPVFVTGPTHSGCGFAVFNSSNKIFPDPIRQEGEAQNSIIPILNFSDVNCFGFPQLKRGDMVKGVKGPLTYHFDLFKIVLQEKDELEIKHSVWPELSTAPDLSENQISIVTYNLENFFDDKRDSRNSAEPIYNQDTLNIKTEKVAYDLSEILKCPTLIGVQEIENEKLLQGLTSFLQKDCGFNYQISHRDGPDSRGLDVALLSDPRKVIETRVIQNQTCTELETDIVDPDQVCPENQYPLFGRPPLLVEAQIDGTPFTVIVVHLKSKRGDELDSAKRRYEQASFVKGMVEDIITTQPETQIIVLGDMNDFEQSQALVKLTSDGILKNALTLVPLGERYSYIFDGRTQLIDGLLVSENLASQIAEVNIFHINSPFPVELTQDISPAMVPYRGSDHDIPFMILNLRSGENPPADTTADLATISSPKPVSEDKPETKEPIQSYDLPMEKDKNNVKEANQDNNIPIYLVLGGLVIAAAAMWGLRKLR